jgi:uncharacterized cupin superfamily protein
MSVTPNVFSAELDEEIRDRDGFWCRGTMVAKRAGSERLGASVYELPPGQANAPYHYHFANEELLIVLRGRPHLRTPAGWRQLEEGEVVAFPLGERGAHQVVNRTGDDVRVVIVSEMRSPEIPVYPDSGKVGVREYASGSGKEGMRMNFRMEDEREYWDGERPPEVPG